MFEQRQRSMAIFPNGMSPGHQHDYMFWATTFNGDIPNGTSLPWSPCVCFAKRQFNVDISEWNISSVDRFHVLRGDGFWANVVLELDDWSQKMTCSSVHLVVWIRNASALLQPYILGASSRLPRYYCAQKESPDPDAYDNNEIEIRLIVPHLHPILHAMPYRNGFQESLGRIRSSICIEGNDPSRSSCLIWFK
jgi:hypothetical protein